MLVRRGPGGRPDAAGRRGASATSARMRWLTSARSTSRCTRPGRRSTWPPPRSTPTRRTARTAAGCAPCACARSSRPSATEVMHRVGRALGRRPAVPRRGALAPGRGPDRLPPPAPRRAQPGRARHARDQPRRHVVGLAANRIDRPGTPQEAWDSWPDLRRLPPADPSAWPSVVVVAAHPDDEVLGVGGTMAHPGRGRGADAPDRGHRRGGVASGADPAVIGRTRTAESAAALGLLGVRAAEVVRLRLPDTGLAAHEDELADLLRELCAGFEVCLAPWEGDAHADHEAAGRAARQAGLADGRIVLSYPIWMWHWAKSGSGPRLTGARAASGHCERPKTTPCSPPWPRPAARS